MTENIVEQRYSVSYVYLSNRQYLWVQFKPLKLFNLLHAYSPREILNVNLTDRAFGHYINTQSSNRLDANSQRSIT